MADEHADDWWSRGEECEGCGISFCTRHSPHKHERQVGRATGPLGTNGLDSLVIDGITVYFLDTHYEAFNRRTPVGEAVYRGKSYDGKAGSRVEADSVASASAHWLAKMFGRDEAQRLSAVVAVPRKPERRGLSLPGVIAVAVGQALGIPVIAPLRWKPGTPQAKTLTGGDRKKALHSQLEIIEAVSAGTILLVDDVLHTGATISVAANSLKQAGASKVVAYAPSRAAGLRRDSAL